MKKEQTAALPLHGSPVQWSLPDKRCGPTHMAGCQKNLQREDLSNIAGDKEAGMHT